MKILIRYFVCLCFITGSLANAQNNFQQAKVNNAYFMELNRLLNGEKKKLPAATGNRNFLCHTFDIADTKHTKKFPDNVSKGDLYVGANDTVIINSDTSINNNIIVYKNGVVIIDNAKLTLSGSIYMIDSSIFFLRNNAHLSFSQFYFNQYGIHLLNNSLFHATYSTIDGNGLSVNEIELYDNAAYIAKNVTFNDWSFRKLFDKSTLILEDVNYVGDMLVKDSCNVTLKRCRLILPWLEIPDNANISLTFPPSNPANPADTIFHFEFNESLPGADGIGYSITIDTSTTVMWALDVQPGSNLSVSNSIIFGFAHRFIGADTVHISGLFDSTLYQSLSVPFNDRICQLTNSFVYSWQLYGQKDSATLYIDSCSFGELMAKQNCDIYATRSVCDGIWLHLGAVDNGFIGFSDGLVKSFADTWQNSTLLLTNSEIRAISGWAPPPSGPNYAHHHSYFLAVNSEFDYIPYAFDTSLVMFVYIDSLKTIDTDTMPHIPIYGSAWLQAGVFNTTAFQQYKLYYQPIGSDSWFFINGNTDTIHNNLLGIWNTNGLTAGDYIIRLTILDSNNDSLSALRKVTLINSNQAEAGFKNKFLFSIYPNPARDLTLIEFSLNGSEYVILDVIDASGRKISTLTNAQLPAGKHTKMLETNCLQSGCYFIRLKTKEFEITKKLEVTK